MKVMRLTTLLNFGGIEKVFELHAKYHNKKYELIFVSLGAGGYTEKQLIELGYRVIVLNTPYKIPSWSCLKFLYNLFKSERPDVVHTCGGEANFHGLIAAFFAGVPRRIGEEIGIPGHSGKFKLVFRIVYLFANRVIGVSKAVKDFLVKYEVPREKVLVIYNPVDKITNTSVQLKKRDVFYISYTGRLIHHKNLTLLIDLIGRLNIEFPRIRFELWLIGDGSERAYLMEYARKEGVEGQVKFMGFVKDPVVLISQTNLFILPSVNEGFGLACIEAMQSGVIVIATSVGGIGEYIIDGENGFLFDPYSLEELLAKTKHVIGLDDQQANLIISNAKKKVEESFSPEQYIESLVKVYYGG
jgi:glycosyltransferase involved in cell wall biosynthesis